MSKTKMLRTLVSRHAPAEVNDKLRSLILLEARINELQAERNHAIEDLLSPKSEEPSAVSARNGHAVAF